MNLSTISTEFARLTEDIDYRKKMKSKYARIEKTLGNNPVSETAAQLIYKYLKD
jgi:lipid A disaccharide synthetase